MAAQRGPSRRGGLGVLLLDELQHALRGDLGYGGKRGIFARGADDVRQHRQRCRA